MQIHASESQLRRCTECSEHTSLKSAREKRNTASEREWEPQTVETFWREDALRAEKDSLIDFFLPDQRENHRCLIWEIGVFDLKKQKQKLVKLVGSGKNGGIFKYEAACHKGKSPLSEGLSKGQKMYLQKRVCICFEGFCRRKDKAGGSYEKKAQPRGYRITEVDRGRGRAQQS